MRASKTNISPDRLRTLIETFAIYLDQKQTSKIAGVHWVTLNELMTGKDLKPVTRGKIRENLLEFADDIQS